MLYDIEGKLISELVSQDLNPGKYVYTYKGIDLSGGVYIYKIDAGDFTESIKNDFGKIILNLIFCYL